MSTATKNILVLTYGPVPTPKYQTIEGGGMRCWGLAEGLRDNGHTVTVAVNSGFPQEITHHNDITLTNWQLDESFTELINSFDAVVMSYCMGDLSVYVVDHISPKVTLVLDCYVPIYIEVSARNSENLAEEYRNYFPDVQRFNHVLRRGDYFLCANEPQKHMYMGILGSLGVLNPRSYSEKRVLEVPFGISAPASTIPPAPSPYTKLGITKNDFVLLWFGALYPWFSFKPMLDAIEELSRTHKNFKFVLVGGKNPYNRHPDFTSQYNYVSTELKKRKLLNTSSFLIDWVDYNTREKWYQGAHAVISINRDGDENIFSWRTRVMDYVWGGIPMLTNGGDPLSEYLIGSEAALRIKTEPNSIIQAITELMDNPQKLTNLSSNLEQVQSNFLWPKVTTQLSEKLLNHPHPYDSERIYAVSIGLTTPPMGQALTSLSSSESKVSKVLRYVQKAREKGLKRSLGFALDIAKAKTIHTLSPQDKAKPRAILLSHPIDSTGAPLVLLEIAKDISKRFGARNTHIAAPNIEPHLLREVNQAGFVYHKIAEGVGDRIINTQLNIQKNDFVLMNTVALHENYKQYIYRLLEHGRLNHATWFIHEDKPEIRLTNLGEVARIRHLIESGKLEIIVPSQQTAVDYNEYIDTKKVRPISLRVDMPDKFIHNRPAEDYEKVKFVISGTPSDGRKGQLLFLSALELAVNKLNTKNTPQRSFEIHFISIGDDYVSEQIKAVGVGFFGDRFHHYPKMPRIKALEIMDQCNVTVCTSLNETFALFVAEGMMMGHVILRNHSSGWNEQMQDGVNGYLVDNLDISDLAKRLEQLLDKSVLSNEKLAAMGASSSKIASRFRNSNYLLQIVNHQDVS